MENGAFPEDANEHCPGPQSETAGKSDSCSGCPNQKLCASVPKGPDPVIHQVIVESMEPELVHIGLYAIMDIAAEEEISRDYGRRSDIHVIVEQPTAHVVCCVRFGS